MAGCHRFLARPFHVFLFAFLLIAASGCSKARVLEGTSLPQSALLKEAISEVNVTLQDSQAQYGLSGSEVSLLISEGVISSDEEKQTMGALLTGK